MLDWNLLAELVAAPGLPGREGPVAAVIEKALPPGFEVSRDGWATWPPAAPARERAGCWPPTWTRLA